MDRSPLADPAAVAAMVAGDPAGLEAVYRRYADRLYAYARSIVDDADAADVVQETFILAQERVRQLRDPARLGSWLYAIARNECLARLRARKRTVMLAEPHEPVLDTDPGRAVHAAQVRELVHAASTGMNEGDREVFELTVRHGLSAAEVGQVLGISDKHAHARISRVRSQFEGALGALVLARDGRGRCEGLDGILTGWDGTLTALLRKRIERHVRDCAVCSARRRERLNPAALLASYAALPFLAVGAQLWPELRQRLAASLGSPPSSAPAAPPGVSPPAAPAPLSPIAPGPSSPIAPGPSSPAVSGPSPVAPAHGTEPPTLLIRPTPPSRRGSTGRVVALAAVAVLLIVLGAVTVRLLTLDRAAPPGAQPSPTTEAPPATSLGSTVTTTPALTTTRPPPAAAFTVTATAEWVCGTPNEIAVVAHAHGVAFDQATVHWQASGNPSLPMEVDGLLAERQFPPGGSALTLRWWVTATSLDGQSASTAPTVSVTTCV